MKGGAQFTVKRTLIGAGLAVLFTAILVNRFGTSLWHSTQGILMATSMAFTAFIIAYNAKSLTKWGDEGDTPEEQAAYRAKQMRIFKNKIILWVVTVLVVLAWLKIRDSH